MSLPPSTDTSRWYPRCGASFMEEVKPRPVSEKPLFPHCQAELLRAETHFLKVKCVAQSNYKGEVVY